jgi:hypothetical protein
VVAQQCVRHARLKGSPRHVHRRVARPSWRRRLVDRRGRRRPLPGLSPDATTRTSYDDTLARLIDIADGASPVAALTGAALSRLRDQAVGNRPGGACYVCRADPPHTSGPAGLAAFLGKRLVCWPPPTVCRAVMPPDRVPAARSRSRRHGSRRPADPDGRR